jgi:hypothetical protein
MAKGLFFLMILREDIMTTVFGEGTHHAPVA